MGIENNFKIIKDRPIFQFLKSPNFDAANVLQYPE